MNDAIADVIPSYLFLLGVFTIIAMLVGFAVAFVEQRLKQPDSFGSLFLARKGFVFFAAILACFITIPFLSISNLILYKKTQQFFSQYSVIDAFIQESGYGADYLDSLGKNRNDSAEKKEDIGIAEEQVAKRKEKYLLAFKGFKEDGTYGDSEEQRALRKEIVSQFIENPTEISLSTNMYVFAPLFIPDIDDPCPGPIGQFLKMVSAYIEKNMEGCKQLGALDAFLQHVLLPASDGSYYQASAVQIFRGLRTNQHWDLSEIKASAEADIASTQLILNKLEKALYENNKTDKDKVGMLEDVFISYLRKLQDAVYPYMRMQKMINGEIQIMTFALYFFGMMILAVRLAYLYPLTIFPNLKALAGNSNGQDRDKTKIYMEKVINGSVGFVMWALPSVGFIGTVVGISMALGDADLVVTAKGAAEQSDAINQVTSLLSVAFDTTLIALVCSIPVFGCSFWAEAKESKLLS